MVFQTGNNLGEGRQIGSKNRKTIEKEQRRVIFDEQVSQKWEETIDKLKAEYTADQFMGKAPERMNINVFKQYGDIDGIQEDNSISENKENKEKD